MAESVPPKRRGRKPAITAVLADAGMSHVAPPVDLPAADASVSAVALAGAAPLIVAPAAPADAPAEANEPDPASPLAVEQAAPVEAEDAATVQDVPAEDQTTLASAVAEPLSEGSTPMATTYTAPTEATDKAKAMFGEFNDRAKTAMEKSVKIGEEVTEFTKGNVEALVASGRVAAKGAEAMAQDVAESMKKQLESATATMKSFAAVKSPTELFQLQSDYARTYFDGYVAEASKFSESMMKLMGDIAQPLSSRYALAAEKFKASSAL